MSDYIKYIEKNTKFSIFFDTIQYREYNPVPFCIPHVNLLKGNKLMHTKFRKWVNYPKSAYKLYWKFHPKFWKTNYE